MDNIYVNKFRENLKQNLSYFVIVLVSIFTIIALRKFVVMLFFIFMDFMYGYTKKWSRIGTGTNYTLLGSVLLSSQGFLLLGIIIIPFYLINRLLLGKFYPKYFTDMFTLLLVALLASVFSNISLPVLTISLYLFKYVIDMILQATINGGLRFDNTIYRIFHLLIAYIFMSWFGNIFISILR